MRLATEIVKQTRIFADMILIGASVLVAYYATDRSPPFAVLSVYPAAAMPGEYITIQAKVRRDIHRKCDAEFSRYLLDSKNNRVDLGHSLVSAEMIEDLEKSDPGDLRITVLLPPSMQPGPGKLRTVLAYQCNKIHAVWPIVVTTDMGFTVLSR